MVKKQILFKVLGRNGEPCNGGSGRWSLPKGGNPGKWMPKILRVQPCSRGYHLCRPEDLMGWWSGPCLYLAEMRGKVVRCDNKVVAAEARLVRRVEVRRERAQRLLACDFAEHVIHIFEKQRTKDHRPRNAIKVARRFAVGKATRRELAAARDTAWAAAEAAARAAAEAAARAAAGAAAGAAAWAAAEAAARAAAGAAARAAAGDAEKIWQTRCLLWRLGLGAKPE